MTVPLTFEVKVQLVGWGCFDLKIPPQICNFDLPMAARHGGLFLALQFTQQVPPALLGVARDGQVLTTAQIRSYFLGPLLGGGVGHLGQKGQNSFEMFAMEL